jgi:hypothetical protein
MCILFTKFLLPLLLKTHLSLLNLFISLSLPAWVGVLAIHDEKHVECGEDWSSKLGSI